MNLLHQYRFGDMDAAYLTDDAGHVGLSLVPAAKATGAERLRGEVEPLVQLYLRGDRLPGGFANGLTMSGSGSTDAMRFLSQTVEHHPGGTAVVTRLEDGRGHALVHTLTYRDGTRALALRVVFENHAPEAAVLESLSSFSLGGLTPFGDSRATDDVVLHRARSWWSDEGKIESGTLTDYHLEPSWAAFGARVEKFGQTGSMPVRRYFPFLAAEDRAAGVVWAVQLGCAASWQMEARRQRGALCLTGGLADYDFGHWQKTVAGGESFAAPTAFVTVGEGTLDAVAQRLLDLHDIPGRVPDAPLPVLFNEYCTTWGAPTAEKVRRIADALRGHGIDTFIIDAGWYDAPAWDKCIGDWDVSQEKFPGGLTETVQALADAGMNAGLWFEAENVTPASRTAREHPDWLLTRNGVPICTGRMFLDMKKPQVRAHLQQKVIGLLRRCGFRYVKIDYNDSIGVGCDDADGLGEGLRRSIEATQEFFCELRQGVPGIRIENCASGGHRLEPSMMALCDFASFSDAHECAHIPIIAANLHRLIRPEQSQIWAALRRDDSMRRLNYSLVNTLLGVMCLSGDVLELSEAQWTAVDRAIAFYRAASPVIKNGTTAFFGGAESWAHPEGWQAVVRTETGGRRTLVVLHTFGGALPDRVSLPVSGRRVEASLCSEGNDIRLRDGKLEIELKANFEAAAVLLADA